MENDPKDSNAEAQTPKPASPQPVEQAETEAERFEAARQMDDLAGRSLADALRTSFALLTVIMLGLLLAYVFSGIFTVESYERAVVLRFGGIVGASDEVAGKVLKSGLHFRWPFPVDQEVIISTRQRSLDINTMWHFERPEDVGKPESEKRPAADGLRPRFDGALLTGDHGLMHLKWTCTYQIPEDSDQAVLNYVNNVSDENLLVRSVIENASIRTAVEYPVEAIWRGNEQFRIDTTRRAQMMFQKLGTGLRIIELKLVAATPPLQTLAAFQAVTTADQLREQDMQNAMKAATQTLQAAAGENTRKIHELILAYEQAVSAGGDGQAEREAIMALIEDDATQGEVRKMIQEAKAASASLINEAKQNYEIFTKYRQAYNDNPDLTVSRLWMQTRQDIFTGEKNIRLMFPKSSHYVLSPKLDPEILRRVKLAETREDARDVRGYPSQLPPQ